MSPSPTERHQRALGELYTLLKAAAPSGLRVYAAPLDVRFSLRVQTQPDLLVVEDGPPRDKLERLPLVDPQEPSLLALERRDGAYREAAHVVGDQGWTAARPYPVTVVPADLLR